MTIMEHEIKCVVLLSGGPMWLHRLSPIKLALWGPLTSSCWWLNPGIQAAREKKGTLICQLVVKRTHDSYNKYITQSHISKEHCPLCNSALLPHMHTHFQLPMTFHLTRSGLFEPCPGVGGGVNGVGSISHTPVCSYRNSPKPCTH